MIGAGNIGRTLGGKWATAGHQVVYGVRSPGRPARRRSRTRSPARRSSCSPSRERPRRTSSPRSATALAGKVVIDATNDVQGIGKLHALEELTDGAHPVRAFNTLGWENFAEPVFDGVTADLFYAAEEGRAKEVADRLIADVGLRPVWLGGVDAFDLVDSLTRLWFTLAFQRKLGRRLAFKMLVPVE